MDGLDIYVGDYTQADPMPAGMLDKLSAVYKMLDPVEPPPEETKAAANIAPPASAVPIAETAPAADAPSPYRSAATRVSGEATPSTMPPRR